MIEACHSGVLLWETASDGRQTRRLILPPRQGHGPDLSTSVGQTLGQAAAKVNVMAFDREMRTAFGVVSVEDWADIQRNRLEDVFIAAIRHGLSSRSAVDHCSDVFLARSRGTAEPQLPQANAEVFSHATDGLMARLQAACPKRDAHGFPLVEDGRWAFGSVRPVIAVGEELFIEDDGGVKVLAGEDAADFVAAAEYRAAPPAREASMTEAELFVQAWGEWDEGPRERVDFSDWCRSRNLSGSDDGQFSYVANWSMQPEPARLILDYALMDFSDGSIAVRRNHEEGQWGRPGGWLVGSQSGPLQERLQERATEAGAGPLVDAEAQTAAERNRWINVLQHGKTLVFVPDATAVKRLTDFCESIHVPAFAAPLANNNARSAMRSYFESKDFLLAALIVTPKDLPLDVRLPSDIVAWVGDIPDDGTEERRLFQQCVDIGAAPVVQFRPEALPQPFVEQSCASREDSGLTMSASSVAPEL